MIDVRNLTKIHGHGAAAVQALGGIDLALGTGMFGLLGPNGAGKTTFMRILGGIARPSSGTVSVAGFDLASASGRTAAKDALGYLPQELGLYPELSAERFVDYMAVLKGMSDARERRRRVAEVLDLVALGDVSRRLVGGFSGGMKRRVGIAQALVNDPRVLIVDEPTAGLDPEERIRFRNLLVGLAAERCVVLSTHIVEDIGQTCRDIAVLARGRLLFRGTPSTLAERAAGHVWAWTGRHLEEPPAGLTVVSMMHLDDCVEYRLVGGALEHPAATPVRPSLEDGYVRLMQTARGDAGV